MVKRFLDLGGKSNNQNFFFGKASEKSFEDVCGEIDGFNPWDSVIVYGGEPTAKRDFFRIMARLNSRGIRKIRLITNGRALKYSGFVAKLRGLKGLHVFVELLAPTEDEHDALTKTPGSFRQTMEGIKNLQDKGVSFSLIVPVIMENKNNIPKIGELASLYEIGNIVLSEKGGGVEKILPEVASEFPLLFSTLAVGPKQIPSHVDICDKLENLEELDLEGFPRLRIVRALERFHDKSLIYVSVDEVYYLLDKLTAKTRFLDFAHHVGFPIPVLVYLFEELEKENIISISGEEVKPEIKPNNTKDAESFMRQRLKEDPSICQLRVEENALLRRADFIAENCLGGGRIAVLGDDDFFSLILASKNVFDEVFVFELDERICDRIKEIAQEKGYNIKIIKQDLRKTFSPELLGKFDVFYTDSPYSVNGFTLFFSRGLQLLKNERKKTGFMSFSPNLFIETVEMGVQRVINDSGVFIERKNLGANNEMPESIKKNYADFRKLREKLDNYKELGDNDSWFLSSLGREERLFRFLTTSITRPLITGKFDDEIYYGENPLAYYADLESIREGKSSKDIFKY